MSSASKLLLKLSQKLFVDPLEQTAFVEALVHPTPHQSCILWLKPRPEVAPFTVEPPLPWQPAFIDRLAIGTQPGLHALHAQGDYYCLDFSSVFAASVMQTLPISPTVVIDICAAPGGKGIFAARNFAQQQLICNETISKRVGMLIGNLKRCHIHPAIALSTDPAHLALHLSQTADLAIVDAPCSGQSLLAKGGQAAGCFHPLTIRQNAQRQKRILAQSAHLVAPQGYLAYMTCTFSPEENEQVGQWFLKKFSQFKPQLVPPLAAYQSHLSELPCYRMWPHLHPGAGAFTMLFHNTETGDRQPLPSDLWPGWRWSSVDAAPQQSVSSPVTSSLGSPG
ncbi:MAG: RsmB/NOP family class I SAM-dependent RNA methyltransferase [Thermosynechococcaceae cyanobacterium MS004]|nr:RsmB/NOP family class I SAM-dependent RNA methyltransferase [Thermosynechococcaceae cyanobacterium MS004]